MSDTKASPGAASEIYVGKPSSYFANARHDIVGLSPTGPKSSVLELGCGAGGTGRAMLAAGKAGRYVGIELSETAAAKAAEDLSDVWVGDVEAMDLSGLADQFDALIISEVLEHLRDPWTTLQRLVACLKPGGSVFASSPNVSHWMVVRDIFMGHFRYAESGAMDRTHLRWFTPESYREMFEEAGVVVDRVGPLVPLRWKARLIGGLSGGRLDHLFAAQIMICGRRLPK
jgi:2-polyprenyl-3-methyl-5-hydroxy-6-metoxy-1,4-benzoquinol methylase